MNKLLYLGTAVLAVSSCKNVPTLKEEPLPILNYSLAITPDGTEFDTRLALKTIKLAEFVVEHNYFKPVYNNSRDVGYSEKIRIGDRTYLLAVYDQQELTAIDILDITISDILGEQGEELIDNPSGIHVMIHDYGLDGKCNFGMSAEHRSDDIKLFRNSNRRKNGLEHQAYYQRLYEEAIDVLIKHYEEKEKGRK